MIRKCSAITRRTSLRLRQLPLRSPAASKPHDDGPPTTLVFRDGKRMETQNYAIVGNTLWLMADNGHMQKVPLSELDREATLKSNEDRGVEFTVPQQQ